MTKKIPGGRGGIYSRIVLREGRKFQRIASLREEGEGVIFKDCIERRGEGVISKDCIERIEGREWVSEDFIERRWGDGGGVPRIVLEGRGGSQLV